MPGPEGEEDKLIRQIEQRVCPFCFTPSLPYWANDAKWRCRECQARWTPLSVEDRRMLKALKIAAD